MTFDKLRDTVVKEKKFATQKELVKVVINLALSIVTYSFALGLAINSILGYRFLFALLLIAVCAFLWICDFSAETKESFVKVQKLTRLWWTGIIAFVVIYIVLKIFNFL